MKKLYAIAASALALAATTAPASAAQYLFSFTPSSPIFGPQVSGNGIFTTSDTAMIVGGQTAFSILSVSGTVNGSAINASFGNGFSAGGTYGNYFTTGPGFLDGSGTRFFNAAGLDVRFFQQSSNGLYRVNTFGQFGSSNFVTASSSLVQAVPEPSTWLMMIAGFGLIGFAMRRRTKTRMVVSFA
jgi:opacity protein-like surface antigen